MLKLGTVAPVFTLPLGSGGDFALDSFRGTRLVLYFYPRAFTHG